MCDLYVYACMCDLLMDTRNWKFNVRIKLLLQGTLLKLYMRILVKDIGDASTFITSSRY